MEGTDGLSGILDAMEEGILVLNNKGELISWNQQLLRMFHLPPATPREVDDPKQVLDLLLECIPEQSTLTGVLRDPRTVSSPITGTCRLPGKPEVTWKMQEFTITDTRTGTICTFKEKETVVPQSGETTPALIGTNEKLRKIINSSPDSIVISDLDGNITYYNDETTRMYECDKEHSLIGTNVFDLICEQDRETAYHRVSQVLNRGTVKNIEYRIINCRKRIIDIEASVSSLEDPNGEPIALIAISQDVTERNNMRRLLQEREKKFRSIFDNAGDAIILIDPEGYHLDSNRGAWDLTGYSREAISRTHFTDIIAPEHHALSQQIIGKLKSGQEGGTHEKTFITRDGRHVPVEMTVSPLYDNQGTLSSILSVVRDISERKHFEQQLIQARQKAEESDRLKSTFLANMSHEIRTPMNGIMGFAEMLKRNNLSEEKKHLFINIINNSAGQLLGIINDIVDISKLETGQQKLFPETFNLNHFMKETHTLFLSTAREKNLQFHWHRGLEDEHSGLTTDKTKLQQILNNLLNNAFKFTREGKVEFGYDRQGDELCFYVSDTGPGIPPDMRKKVFERFAQLDETASVEKGGTGLGLSISKGLTELLGGSIQADSQPGEGTTFSFRIPYLQKNSTSQNQKPEAAPASPVKATTHSILLVEDDLTNAIYVKEVLQTIQSDNIRFRVQHVTRGNDAIVHLEQQDWDLVLLDLKLPDISGIEVIQAIHKTKPHLPVIAQTAYAQAEYKNKTKEAGFADYIAKPISPEILQKKIIYLLKNHFPDNNLS